MKFINNLSIRSNLILLALLALLPMFLAGSVSLILAGQNVNEIKKMARDDGYIVISLVINADRDMYQALTAFQLVRYAGQKDKIKDFKDNVAQSLDRIEKAEAVFKQNETLWNSVKHPQTGKSVFEHYEHFKATFAKWVDAVEEFTASGRPSDPDWESYFDQAREDINAMGELTDSTTDTRVNAEIAQYYRLTTTFYIIMFVILVGVSFVVYFIIGSITTPLKNMVGIVDSLAKGDFTRTLKFNGSREITQLVNGLNHAISTLRNLITNVTEQSQIVAKASKELSDASSESGKSASEVARAIESMAKATAEQTEQINQTATNVTQLGQLVKKVSTDSLRIAEYSKQVSNSAQNGQKISTAVASDIGELYQTTKEISVVIGEMNQSSDQIQKISALIEGFAGQTSLLALNAAIEAARAGEHGRGFSVVSNETGKLAEQSKQSSQNISNLIASVLDHSTHAVETIQKGVEKVEASKTLTTEAASTFGTIFKQLEDNLTQIKDVAVSAQKMALHNDEVVNAITSLAAISEESMATTEEISAAVQEQSASAEEVAALASNLSDIAETMKKSVAMFRV